MTSDRWSELEELMNAAAPADKWDESVESIDRGIWSASGPMHMGPLSESKRKAKLDAALIVAMRNALPELLAAARRESWYRETLGKANIDAQGIEAERDHYRISLLAARRALKRAQAAAMNAWKHAFWNEAARNVGKPRYEQLYKRNMRRARLAHWWKCKFEREAEELRQ